VEVEVVANNPKWFQIFGILLMKYIHKKLKWFLFLVPYKNVYMNFQISHATVISESEIEVLPVATATYNEEIPIADAVILQPSQREIETDDEEAESDVDEDDDAEEELEDDPELGFQLIQEQPKPGATRQEKIYTEQEIVKINRDKMRWRLDMEDMMEQTISTVFRNQRESAREIVENFENKQIVIQLAIGKTQSGKTGCMVALIDEYITRNVIPINNIYLITGLSSRDWISQCRERFPRIFSDNIYHCNQLKEFETRVKSLQNVLVIIDEAHVASRKYQTIHLVFSRLRWNLTRLLDNDIKIVQFSATPDGLLYTLQLVKWPYCHWKKVIMPTGDGYFGYKDMKLLGNTIQFVENDELEYIKQYLTSMLSFTEPRFLIVREPITKERRISNRKIIPEIFHKIIASLRVHFSEHLHKFNTTKFHYYAMKGNVNNIKTLLNSQPASGKHEILIVRELIKCSQTIPKRYIGVVAERSTKTSRINDSFVIQSLLGRLCGYEPHDAICYTDLNPAEAYELLFENNFSEEVLGVVNWKYAGSSKIDSNYNFNLYNKPSSNIDSELNEESQKYCCKIMGLFETHQEALDFAKRGKIRLSKKEPKKNKKNKYKSELFTNNKKENRVVTFDELEEGFATNTFVQLQKAKIYACHLSTDETDTQVIWVLAIRTPM
jgi:hypothetical protein